jgi:2-polyprenyl-3-methyl-5-hydroxy-6-metoxy-1,4-benzoquinol methylase
MALTLPAARPGLLTVHSSVSWKGASDIGGEKMTGQQRFAFGKNWQRFLNVVDDGRIQAAVQSLQEMLGVASLAGKSFLDVGCGSGLFSLAARKLGASVRSFDCDAQCVACVRELKRRYYPQDSDWVIENASVLDEGYLRSLGQFDVVYAWGVLHHTGEMWNAVKGVSDLVNGQGRLCLSIYNDQDYVSRSWRLVKKTYQRLPPVLRPCLVLAVGAAQFAARSATTIIAVGVRLVSLRNPLIPIINWHREARTMKQRGMHWWNDLVDWVGGYPFEVAKPEAVFNFCHSRGFTLVYMTTQGGGHGCNHFTFVKSRT